MITFNDESLNHKPTESEYPMLKMSYKNRCLDISIAEIADRLSEGQAMHTSCFKLNEYPTICKSAFMSADFLALDFDNDEPENYPYRSFEAAKDKLLSMGLYPCIMYPTYSSTDYINRYRVVFKLAETIPFEKVRKLEILLKMLFILFPDIDAKCVEISRMFLGTNKPLDEFYIDEASTFDEIKLFHLYLGTILGDGRHQKGTFKKTIKEWGVIPNENCIPHVLFNEENKTIHPDFFEDSASLSMFTDTDTGERGHRLSSIPAARQSVALPPKRAIEGWEDKLLRISKLYQKFHDGIPINYTERMFLYLNLNHIKGGQRRMKEILQQYISNYDHELHHYLSQMRVWKWYMNNPQKLAGIGYAEQYDDWLARCGASTIVEALGNRDYFLPQYIPEADTSISADDAQEALKAHFYRCLDADDNKVYGIKAGVGVGKTEIYVNYDYSRFHKVLIVVPTHQLAKEVESRMLASGVNSGNIARRPQKPEIPDAVVDANYKKCLKLGAYNKSEQIYHRYFRTNPTEEYQRYLDAEERARNSKIMISTHSYALYTNQNDEYDLVIIDEDILNSLIEIKSVKYSDLKLFSDNCNSAQMQAICTSIMPKVDATRLDRMSMDAQDRVFSDIHYLNNDIGYDETVPEFNDDVLENLPNAEVMHFFKSKAYCINGENSHMNGNVIFYSVVRPFNFGCKTVILSATLSKDDFEKYFEGRRDIEFMSVNRIKNLGMVQQDLRYSCSDRNMEENGNRICEYIKANIEGWESYKVITFRKHIERFRMNGFQIACDDENNEIYFGNLMGIDNLKGENLLVVGKYSPPEQYYRLYADALGYNIPRCTQTVSNATINQHETKLYQFTDATLARLQREKIEAEITQAVGRGRTARTNSNVYVFCDLPLDIADITTHNFIELKNIRRTEVA